MNYPENIYVLKNINLILKLGDLTEQSSEVIVNAANTRLHLGSGVAGAIKIKGGNEIQKECTEKHSLNGSDFNTGDAIETGVGNFKNYQKTKNLKYIFHAIGPYYQGGNNDEKRLLGLAYKNSISLANKLQIHSMSFPPISTGVYRYPKEECAKIFLDTIKEYSDEVEKSKEKEKTLKDISLCIIDNKTYDVFSGVFEKYFSRLQ